MTEDAKREIGQAIFHQRPLKSAKSLIGHCELERAPERIRRRAPLALLVAQRFRMLQAVNHLEIINPDNTTEKLSDSERTKLLDHLERFGDLPFSSKERLDLKKLLDLKPKTTFNLARGGEKRLVGNRTRAKLEPIVGDRWSSLTDAERDELTLEVLHYQKPSALERRARNRWGLSAQAASALADVTLEQGYASHCRRHLEEFVRRMEPFPGLSYSEARQEADPRSFLATAERDLLPPVLDAAPNLRNPAVTRALTELRKVVNSLIGRYGKPQTIRIELARDLKKGRKERESISKRIEEQTKRRESAVRRIVTELPGQFPSKENVRRSDIDKVLLAEECNWRCPFTRRGIDMSSLLGPAPQFDVAHLYPRRYMDDSFANLTLCYHEENRVRMRDQLPFEAYGQNPQRWAEIIAAFKKFKGPAATEKLRRLQSSEVPDGFARRQLNDTRYNSAQAADYLGLLFGGRVDAAGKCRIETIAGGITGHIRNVWGLNAILGTADVKNRSDHRQHAVDAVILALTDAGLVAKLQQAASEGELRGTRTYIHSIPTPDGWCGDFFPLVGKSIKSMIVSHRVNRKLGGPLHAETNYSPPIASIPAPENAPKKRRGANPETAATEHHIRKPVHRLSATDLKEGGIVDPVIRRIIVEALAGRDPKTAFAAPEDHPYLTSKDGRKIPIHKVRVRSSRKAFPVGEGKLPRFVGPAQNTNFIAVVYAVLDRSGKEVRWRDVVIPRLDAALSRDGRCCVFSEGLLDRLIGDNSPHGYSVKLHFMKNDSIVMTDDQGVRQLYRVENLSEGDHQLSVHWDGRDSKEMRKPGQRKPGVRASAAAFRDRDAKKVEVTPTGEMLSVGQLGAE